MANAYLVGIYNKIIDQEKLQKYAVDALPAMMANGGKKALARSGNITQIEGIPPERAVILEFENVDLAIVNGSEHPPHIAVVDESLEETASTMKHKDGSIGEYVHDGFGNFMERIKYKK